MIWENGTFNEKGNLDRYRETTLLSSKGFSLGVSNVKVVERNGTTYDRHGRVARVNETTTDTAQPGVKVTTERENTAYDLMGREVGIHSLRHEAGMSTETMPDGEIVLSNLDKWSTLVQMGRTFNDVGQLAEFFDLSFDGNTVSLAGSDVEWKSLSKVQKDGILSGTSPAEEAVTIVHRAGMTYNARGESNGYTEHTRELSTALDHNWTTVRSELKYNDLHQAVDYKDELKDDATPGVTETALVTGAQYNGFGQMTAAHQVKDQAGALVSHWEGDRTMRYDSEGRSRGEHSRMVSANGITVDRDYSVSAINALGRASAERTVTTKSGVDSEGTPVYEITTDATKSAMGYDDHGRLAHSKETVRSSDKPDVVTTTVWDALSFNDNNQLVSTRERKSEENPAGIASTDKSRTNAVYDEKGRAKAYKETTTGTADALTEIFHWTSRGYGGAGRSWGLSEPPKVSDDSKTPFDLTTTVQKEGIQYDLPGNVLHYTQSGSGSDKPDLINNVVWDGAYDSLQRMVTSKETITSVDAKTKGDVLNTTTVNERKATFFDSLNRTTGYTQVMTDALGNGTPPPWCGPACWTVAGWFMILAEETTDGRETSLSNLKAM